MRLSEKQRNEPPVKLTRAEKREIQAIIRKYKGDGKAHSAQASIPYQAMYPDGICKVTANTFSKCIEFADISYQLAQADTKTAIFENLCDLYNYLDASIHVQLSFVNRKTDPEQYAKSFEIKAQGDDFDDIRAEYSGILQDQLVRGNNGLTKRKFLTFTIEADNLKMARARLTRIETDLLGYFKTMGAVAHVLDAKERLEVLHGVLHPDAEPFQFEWKWLAPSGLSTKDFIAPSSFRFGNSRMFGLGGKYGAVSFLNILSPELSDEMLADFLNTENGIVVNLHVQAIDQTEAINEISIDFPEQKISHIDSSTDLPNVSAVYTKWQEQTFLTGVVAGLGTLSGMDKANSENVVGVILGQDQPTLRMGVVGFEAGVRYVNPDCEVLEAVVGDFNDPAKAKEIALSMYNRGADFVQHIAGASGMGVFTAAKEADRYAFGVGGNQNYIEPDYIVATALRDVNTIVYNEIKALVEGTWEPGVHISGIAEGSVGFDNTDSNVVLPDDIAAAVEDIKAKITAGELVPCETAEELDAWVAANQYQPAE